MSLLSVRVMCLCGEVMSHVWCVFSDPDPLAGECLKKPKARFFRFDGFFQAEETVSGIEAIVTSLCRFYSFSYVIRSNELQGNPNQGVHRYHRYHPH